MRVCIVGFAMVKLKAELHKYRSTMHSTLIFHHADPLNWLEKVGQYTAKTIFRIKCITNGDLPYFACLNSRFNGYICW